MIIRPDANIGINRNRRGCLLSRSWDHVLRIVCGTIVYKTGCFASMKVSQFAQEFGGKVRALREARGMSQETLADTARLHRTHISLIERGHRSVRLETVERLALALGVQPARLMPTVRLQPVKQL
jgi:DNA-binding XRE family transcriptional regulator